MDTILLLIGVVVIFGVLAAPVFSAFAPMVRGMFGPPKT